jgi:hypothetical protein
MLPTDIQSRAERMMDTIVGSAGCHTFEMAIAAFRECISSIIAGNSMPKEHIDLHAQWMVQSGRYLATNGMDPVDIGAVIVCELEKAKAGTNETPSSYIHQQQTVILNAIS